MGEGWGECKWHRCAVTHPFTDFIHVCVFSHLDSCVAHVKSEMFFVPKTGRRNGVGCSRGGQINQCVDP